MRKPLLAVALIALSAGAQATTYVSTRTVGDATAKLSITTDDTIGVLTAGKIVDWTVVLTRGAKTTTLDADNSLVLFSGGSLSATATDLSFNFSGPTNNYFGFLNNDGSDISTYRSLWCVQTTNCFDQNQGEEIVRFGFLPDSNPTFDRVRLSGVQVIASIAEVTAPVPEPATWAMMLAGFGITGAALRRRRQAAPLAA